MELIESCEVAHTAREKSHSRVKVRAESGFIHSAPCNSIRGSSDRNPNLAVGSKAGVDGIGTHLCARRMLGYAHQESAICGQQFYHLRTSHIDCNAELNCPASAPMPEGASRDRDFWPIIAIEGVKMGQKSGPVKKPEDQFMGEIRCAIRRQFSAEEKIRIVLIGLSGRTASPP